MPVRIKICCISSLEEARQAIHFGASALGLVAEMPSGPGTISDEEIARIAAKIPPPVASFLLTSRTDAAAIVAHQQAVMTNTIQLVDALSNGSYAMIKARLPGVRVVQVIHVLDERSVDEALAVAGEVDALLLDSGTPNLQVKQLGGTGRTHNWKLSAKIVAQAPVPVFLAGGLGPANIREAIEAVQPFGVDICSGVRTADRLDPQKLEHFVSEVFGI